MTAVVSEGSTRQGRKMLEHLWNLEYVQQVPLQLLIHLICHAFILIRAWQLLRQKLDQINHLSRVSTSIFRHVTAA